MGWGTTLLLVGIAKDQARKEIDHWFTSQGF
jgi:hypothetical protein